MTSRTFASQRCRASRQEESMKSSNVPKHTALSAAVALAFASMAAVPITAWGDETAANPNCPAETAHYDPGLRGAGGQDIVVPKGFKVEVFARGLNFPTDIAFVGDKHRFHAVVLESGKGLPSPVGCNNNEPLGKFSTDNPFTPDVIVFDQNGTQISERLEKPTATGGGFQPDGPAIGLSYEHNFADGRLFATDSNQGVRGAAASNNRSRVLEVNISKDR